MFCRIGIVVPLYSHATKSTPIPKNHSTPLFGQNLTIPYPNSHLKPIQNSQQNTPSPHHLFPTSSNYPTSPQTLINLTQIKKISPKNTTTTQHSHIKIHPSTNPNKTLLKLRIIPHIPKISTLI